MFMFSHYTLNAFSPRVFIRYKRHACLMAVLLFICGACCLAWPLVAGWYLATVTGMLLMICGFYSLYSLIVFRQQHWKSRLVALIFAIAWIVLGLSFVVNPLNGMSSLAILFGFLFVLGGISRIVNGCQTRKQSGAGWNIFIGLLDLLIACLWLAMNPQLNLAISARSSKNNPPGIRPGKPAALRRVPLYSSIPHSHGRWRPISLRYKNAPIIAPTTGASSGTRK